MICCFFVHLPANYYRLVFRTLRRFSIIDLDLTLQVITEPVYPKTRLFYFIETKEFTRRSNSAIIKPVAQISTPVPYFFAPNNNSGDRYHLYENNSSLIVQSSAYLVTTSCDINLDGEPKNFARPKSAIFKTPCLSINKLFGFKSRCKIQLLCKYSKPNNNIIIYDLICVVVKNKFRLLMIF